MGGTPGADDWILPCLKSMGQCAGAFTRCECRSHSLFSDIADARVSIRTIPSFRRKRIAAVTLTPSMGVVKHTPRELTPSHYSWWPAQPGLFPASTVVG